MVKWFNNGYLIQDKVGSLYDQELYGYNGIGRYISWPLEYVDDSRSKLLSEHITNIELGRRFAINATTSKEFLDEYISLCNE